MMLWLIFAGLTAAALAAVLWPLLRPRAPGPDRGEHDGAIYRDQLAEIERDLERGVLAPAEAEAARIEIGRRLLAAAEAGGSSARPLDRRAAGGALACAIVCVPVLTLGLYLLYGQPSVPDQPLAARLQEPAQGQQVAGLIARVEARLREAPQDGAGWDVIAPVYLRLGRYEDAADAYARALRLVGESPTRLVGYGEALVNAQNGIVGEAARQAFEKALAADPALLSARFWVATAKAQDGDHAAAAATFRQMLAGAEATAPWRPLVESRLREVETRLRERPDGGEPPRVAERGPTAEDVEAAQAMSPEERSAMVEAMVAGLAARLADDGKDLEGWLRLARAYGVLGRSADARKALDSARHNFHGDRAAASRIDEAARALGL